jgi:hypothetical protein
MSPANPAVSDLDLLIAFEPVVRFTEGELFLPACVEEYVASCELLQVDSDGRSTSVLLGRGEVTLDRLAELGARHGRPGQFLRFVSEPFNRAEQLRWRRRVERPRFRTAGRLSRVGVLSRIVDALLRLSLFFRGSVAKGTQAAAETLYRTEMDTTRHPYYGRVVRVGGYVALQYWFFYAFNDWRSRAYGVNDHEADWEQVVVYLAEQPDGSTEPAWVVFSAHDETGDDLRRRWDDPDLTLVGDHPVVHAGLGSHSGAYLRGEYLTTFEAPAFHRVIRFFRSISRVFLPWTRGEAGAGVGIPYVDYSRGDGVSIGPGQQRQWQPVRIDDETPWVYDYRGLWGNDTEDPFGGERAPAGPRYERSGDVRASWNDVVEWSGLAKVAPNQQTAESLVRRRLEELRAEEDEVSDEVDELRTKLRADVASGIAPTPGEEAELAARSTQRAQLRDERRRLDARLAEPPPPPGPHDHLRHRRVPLATEPRGRRRILAVWSAASTPLILALIGIAFIPGRDLTVFWSAIASILLVFAVEALARGNLFRFVAVLASLVALVVIGATLAGLTVYFGWQATVTICFFALAIVLLTSNLRELARD